MRMFRGDLKPDLKITCYDGDTPVDLTTATGIKVIGVRADGTGFTHDATGNDQGVVTMGWDPADTAAAGTIRVEVEVTWAGAKPQTFRPDDVVQVVPDLG